MPSSRHIHRRAVGDRLERSGHRLGSAAGAVDQGADARRDPRRGRPSHDHPDFVPLPRARQAPRPDRCAPSGHASAAEPAVVGTLATAVLVAGFATQTWLDSAFPGQGWSHLLASAPLVVAAVALNAFSEEVLFRAGPLALLHRIVGPIQAVLMTSSWFGLAHCYEGHLLRARGRRPVGPARPAPGRLDDGTGGLGWPLEADRTVGLRPGAAYRERRSAPTSRQADMAAALSPMAIGGGLASSAGGPSLCGARRRNRWTGHHPLRQMGQEGQVGREGRLSNRAHPCDRSGR
ncbi:CPBP family intramembrane metalloprotease [Blastococcus sp. CT_GayMR19]|nr:CPBP family intramembrane metalloprotease [Blastococcus sp. CT_GayMR19]